MNVCGHSKSKVWVRNVESTKHMEAHKRECWKDVLVGVESLMDAELMMTGSVMALMVYAGEDPRKQVETQH
jgi:hypothetical protein